MSRRTSSLRRTGRGCTLLACACLAALVTAPASLAAALPTPDDPPIGRRTEASPVVRVAPTAATQPKEAAGELGPTPDAPPIAAPPPPAEPRPATTPVPSAPAQPVIASTKRATTTPPAHTPPATKATRVEPKPKAASRRHTREAPAVRPPHDATRLGLPAGALTLGARHDEGAAKGALLAAAALLLFGSGIGGLVVGVVGRRLVRAA